MASVGPSLTMARCQATIWSRHLAMVRPSERTSGGHDWSWRSTARWSTNSPGSSASAFDWRAQSIGIGLAARTTIQQIPSAPAPRRRACLHRLKSHRPERPAVEQSAPGRPPGGPPGVLARSQRRRSRAPGSFCSSRRRAGSSRWSGIHDASPTIRQSLETAKIRMPTSAAVRCSVPLSSLGPAPEW